MAGEWGLDMAGEWGLDMAGEQGLEEGEWGIEVGDWGLEAAASSSINCATSHSSPNPLIIPDSVVLAVVVSVLSVSGAGTAGKSKIYKYFISNEKLIF